MKKDVVIYGVDAARLPVNYVAAVNALQVCERIDECKEWRDRAAAIASYAHQKRDRTMFETAERIKARATRRFGELFEQQRKATRKSVKQMIRDNAVTQSEVHTARAVARITPKVFHQKVEATPPMPVSRLAKLGTNPRGEDESGPIWKASERLRAIMREFPADLLAASIAECNVEQKTALKHGLTPVSEWFDSLSERVGL